VGLGNPGPEYAHTRHNQGADAVRAFAARHGTSLKAEKASHAEVGLVRAAGKVLAVAVPKTYMNESGLAVGALARRYTDQDPQSVVIVHDELDLEPGVVRVKAGGGLAGNNGLRSIEQHLHTRDFLRIRIGIGKPPGRAQGVDHVLRRPGRQERELLDVAAELAADAIEVLASEGLASAMNRFNART
jgi:PTH1 family peptidyl-tRNA hydrolase